MKTSNPKANPVQADKENVSHLARSYVEVVSLFVKQRSRAQHPLRNVMGSIMTVMGRLTTESHAARVKTKSQDCASQDHLPRERSAAARMAYRPVIAAVGEHVRKKSHQNQSSATAQMTTVTDGRMNFVVQEISHS